VLADAFVVFVVNFMFGNVETIANKALPRRFLGEDGRANIAALENLTLGVVDHCAGWSRTEVIGFCREAL
jgi:hypothetical protein